MHPVLPRPARFPYLEHDGVLAFAHRGGALDHAENTMAAFAAAVRLGYRYIETDVHATRDGVLLAFHDDRLDRVTDRTGRIGALDHAVVREARVGGREPIPLLEELLGSWPELRVNIDAKADSAVEPLIAAIRRTGAIDRVCVGGFSGSRTRRVRAALGPRLCTSLGPFGVVRLLAASQGTWAGHFVEGAAQVPVRAYGRTIVTPAFLRAARRAGLQVHVWTIDDAAEMERLLDMGVDGLMTDRPDTLKRVLERRGAWNGGGDAA